MKVIVITAGTSGLGFETAGILARDLNNKLILGSQDQEKAESVVAHLCRKSGNPNIQSHPLNLASLFSIHRFAQKVLEVTTTVDVLACTGGYQNHPAVENNPDGIAKVFMVNHLGQFLLTRLLMPCINPLSGRILLVSGDSHFNQSIRHNNSSKDILPDYQRWHELFRSPDLRIYLPHERAYVRYATSKLCVFFFGYELHLRLQERKSAITVNLFDPMVSLNNIVNQIFTRRYSLKKAAECLSSLMTDPTFQGVTGQFFEGAKPKKSYKETYNQGDWADLWMGSETLTYGRFNI